MATDKEYKKAVEQVKEIKGFYTHLTVYIIINVFLFLINFFTSRGAWWFYWPLLGWGIGVAIHAYSTFAMNKDWEEKKVQEILSKNKTNKKR